MSSHSTLRSRKKKNQTAQSEASLWLTRGIETGIVVWTLFWAVEVSAQNSQVSSADSLKRFTLVPRIIVLSNGVNRSPASLESPAPDLTSADDALSGLKDLGEITVPPKPVKFTFTQSQAMGSTLSYSFKQDPLYVPTSVEILRFRSF